MSQSSSFKIYDASAGSGKTFTLVKVYLSLLLKKEANNPYPFKHILAITFTNKAVGEMKTRIIGYLKAFSDEGILTANDDMFLVLVDELQVTPEALHQQSKLILNRILHNYAMLNVSTIDGFNHTLIRTFAHDLKIPVNFEVELDTALLLQKAVDQLISQAGIDKRLTETLINFALEKTDDDKSWDISRDLNGIAELLTKENHVESLKKLSEVSFDDFKVFRTEVYEAIKTYKVLVEKTSKAILETFNAKGLEKKDFSQGTLFSHFEKAHNFQFYGLYSNKLEQNIEENKVYSKSLDDGKKALIDGLLSEILLAYQTIKKAYYQYKYYTAIYKNITPLSLLNRINQVLTQIKADDNKMLISEFNTIISNEIKQQPTPFIYERIGERFKHYFIDEFQDTSQLQWENMQPLINNTLSGENLSGNKGTAMIVGDAKQAIYRWRGGKAEQFLGLINEDEPFVVNKENIALTTNYRSHEAIVNFNNGFFDFVANNAMSHNTYKNLYQSASQQINAKQKGSVEVSFLEYANKEEGKALYAEEVLERIKTCLDINYQLKDICVLVRKKDEAKTIANYLGEHQIRFTSSDSLLLVNANEVRFINAVLRFFITPEDAENRLALLRFLVDKFEIRDKHTFYNAHIHLKASEFFSAFEAYNIHFDVGALMQLPLYELAETIVRQFNLVNYNNAYIQFYLETVLEFTQKGTGSIVAFLDYFDLNAKKLKISTSEDSDAVKIMTIHSSKGLEFPVVIYPFVDLNIYKEINPQEWVSIDSEKAKNMTTSLIDYSKDFEFYTAETNNIHIDHKAKQELDALNVFYVALTRPSEKLFILAKKDKKPNNESYQGLLYNYLFELDGTLASQDTIILGDANQQKKEKEVDNEPKDASAENDLAEFISIAKEDHNINMVTKFGDLWGTKQEEAIQQGNYIHDIMARVYTKNDVNVAINYQINKGEITPEQAQLLKPKIEAIVNHKDLEAYFSSTIDVYNETDILTANKKILRPDRFVVNNDEAVVIDYKTGLKNPKYKEQIYDYKLALQDTGLKVNKLLLVYINDELSIEEV